MDNLYDVIIVGGGPSGMTAALYLARAKFKVLVLEKENFGGQIAITESVANYPGVDIIGGKELADAMLKQAKDFGAEFLTGEVTDFELSEKIKTVYSSIGTFRCYGILLATGANPRTVGFEGEEAYKGRGISYCATCDGGFFNDKEVFVIGGGYSAAEEGVFLTKHARHVTILIREDDFTCAASVADKARNNPKITVLTNTVMEKVAGDNALTYVKYKNTKNGEITEYHSKNGEPVEVFVFAGYEPATDFLKQSFELDENGYIVTDEAKRTSVDGVYAAGDMCIKTLRQIVTATSDGAMAATELEKYISDIEEREDKNVLDIKSVLDKIENRLTLKLYLDSRPVSAELEAFVRALTLLSDKLDYEVIEKNAPSSTAPYAEIHRQGHGFTGLAFHGVPGGHELMSFVRGLYNAANPGSEIDGHLKEKAERIKKKLDIKVLVTLTCPMCPDLVIAAQHLAALNSNVTASVYDITHFEELRRKYDVMSVPCLVINNKLASFGRMNLKQLLELIENIL